MTVQQSKRRPLSRYLKDFKHSQTHCAHCNKLLDRITLVRRGEIVNKIAISRLDTLMDEAAWLEEQKEVGGALPFLWRSPLQRAKRLLRYYRLQAVPV